MLLIVKVLLRVVWSVSKCIDIKYLHHRRMTTRIKIARQMGPADMEQFNIDPSPHHDYPPEIINTPYPCLIFLAPCYFNVSFLQTNVVLRGCSNIT